MHAGDVLTLDIEKPAAGGRMLARHQGRVVLVSGAIPGERVTARIERVSSAVVFAETVDVTTPSASRRAISVDLRCGGCALAHVEYDWQLHLKQEIVQDAFSRIGRLPLPDKPPIVSSPERGYRMRARLHVSGGRLGFFREGTHDICDPVTTGQLADSTEQWLARASDVLQTHRLDGLTALEIAENVAGDARACHLELRSGIDVAPFEPLAQGLVGLSAQRGDRPEVVVLAGRPSIADTLELSTPSATAVTLGRDVRAFFQSNRFLVERLARHVVDLVPHGPVVDLYAGVGLFGLALAASGVDAVTLVEGDPVGGADLEANARPYAGVRVERRSVESVVTSSRFGAIAADATVIVDPPRTGLSKEVLGALVRAAPPRLVYVSCDPATLARDCRGLSDNGYELAAMTLFDMFPNTAHVEAVAILRRRREQAT